MGRASIDRMNRSKFAFSLPVAGLLIGCDTDQKPAATATLLNNPEVQEAMKAVDSAIDGLEGDVGSFEDENWREVILEGPANAAADSKLITF